ncbi:hypothetical protein NA655_08360 [Pseudomonas kuykendallii]|uniref:Peptidase U49 n=1 Tax=Pseudomonas kuykendallii TaxID=1007099 RepID=A0A1H3EMY2_9PSED|nr:hypothetical protein [Pseudomonas kuykendallii]MCQ4271031.1 hypothetical protein [Pseudomonas kuykendallii]SDX79927.1 hypothetical protein SAMN05216287_3790 [Pseudomonas kuykendallii]
MTGYSDLSADKKRKFEEAIFDYPTLIEQAQNHLEFFIGFNKDHYRGENESIKLTWYEYNGLYAEAVALNLPGKHHEVRISYGTLMELSCDAHALTRFSAGIRSGELADLYKQFGKTPNLNCHGILPEGLEPAKCQQRLYFHALEWIFHHEAAHLLQNHALYRLDGNGHTQSSLSVAEFGSEEANSISGYASEISHVTELAADYEAIYRLLISIAISKRLAAKDGLVPDQNMNETDIWLILGSMASVFLLFYRCNPSPFNGKALGKHPHPAIRFQFAMRAMARQIMSPAFKNEFGIDLDEQRIGWLAHQVFITCGSNFIQRYERDPNEAVEFGNLILLDDSIEKAEYYHCIKSHWERLRREIKTHYPDQDFFLMEFDEGITKRATAYAESKK